MSSITLSSSISQNLYSLQSIQSDMDLTSYRLSTGKKVNSALDDPVNYFAAQGHTQTASDLQVLKDSMSEGIQTLEAADNGIDAILELVNSAISTAKSARDAESSTEAASYVTEFNALLDDIDAMAEDSSYGGTNLLGGTSESLEIVFNATGDNSITVTGADASSSGLGLSDATSWWDETNSTADTTAIDAVLTSLTTAKSTLRSDAETFSNKLNTVTTRQEFTDNMINTLNDGASNLVNADTNEESANLLALQTQQELALNSLSIASDSSSAVLQLFS